MQEQFVGNYTKLSVAEKHCIVYDLMGILDVPEYLNLGALHPSERWGASMKNLIQHWSSLEINHVIAWQRDTNQYGGAINWQTSQWMQTFLYNSCTIELRQCVDVHYDSLDAVEKGGVVYFYFIRQEMFQMNTNVVTALKTTFTTFKKEGLFKIRDENVSVAARQLEVVATCLNEIRELL